MDDGREARADAADGTPRSMPWQQAPRRSPIGVVVGTVFRVLEALIYTVLVPVRMLAVFLGRTLGWLVALPFRMLGALAWFVGYAVIAIVLVLMAIGLLRVVF